MSARPASAIARAWACAALGLLVTAGGLEAQSRADEAGRGAWLAITPWGGFSMRQNIGRIAFDDVVHAGLRLELRRWRTWPFVQFDRFVRPGLECVEPFTCYDEGWQIRGGVTAGMPDDTQPGLHSAVALGLGAGIVDGEASFTYLGGLGLHYNIAPRLAPRLEIRWERYPGIKNIVVAALGLRLLL